MVFDEKGLQSLYSTSDTYSEDLRPRLIGNGVFEEARALQLQLAGTCIEKDKLGNAWNTLQEHIQTLDSQVERDGLMGEPVILFGESISLPQFEVDLAAGIAMFSLMDPEKRRERLQREHLRPDEVHGLFNGFTVRFDKAGAADEDTYTPRLAYQVIFDKTHSPFVGAVLCATGDVGVSLLEFEQDYKLDNMPDSLAYLFRVGTDETHRSVNLINIVLAGTQKHDATRLRCVGYHAEKILRGLPKEASVPAQDALIDLTMHYIDAGARYKIASTECSIVEKKGKGYVETFYPNEGNLYPFETSLESSVFRPAAILKDGQVTYTDRMTMQLAIADKVKERVMYIPMTKVQVFEKQ